MRFESPSFDPGNGCPCLITAWRWPSRSPPNRLAAIDPDGLRRKLATAVMEGANAGIRDPERLVNFALRALPAFTENSLAW